MTDRIVSEEIPFFQVPNAVFEVGLNMYEILVYIYLARCGNGGSKAFPSYQTIADKCGISKRKAIDTVADLQQRKLLKKTVRQGRDKKANYSNLYTVVLDIRAEQQRQLVDELDRLERKGRGMMEAAQAAGATPIKITRRRAIEIGREIEAEQQREKFKQKAKARWG